MRPRTIRATGQTSNHSSTLSNSIVSNRASTKQCSELIEMCSMARPKIVLSLTGRWLKCVRTWMNGYEHLLRHQRRRTRLPGCMTRKALTWMRATFTMCKHVSHIDMTHIAHTTTDSITKRCFSSSLSSYQRLIPRIRGSSPAHAPQLVFVTHTSV